MKVLNWSYASFSRRLFLRTSVIYQLVSKFLKSKVVHSVLQIPYGKMNCYVQFALRYGGAMRDRTADLLRARQALSQLSYNPIPV
jgi:hypothetical protein